LEHEDSGLAAILIDELSKEVQEIPKKIQNPRKQIYTAAVSVANKDEGEAI
jgi:hypothetical protein